MKTPDQSRSGDEPGFLVLVNVVPDLAMAAAVVDSHFTRLLFPGHYVLVAVALSRKLK